MGLNTICTYIPWMLHQRSADTAPSFEGALDFAAFVREAQAQGLMVLLRLGPFIDAEYDFGGLPAWLLTLRDPPLRAIRNNDPAYTAAVSLSECLTNGQSGCGLVDMPIGKTGLSEL